MDKLYQADSSLYVSPSGGTKMHLENNKALGWSMCGILIINDNPFDVEECDDALKCKRCFKK